MRADNETGAQVWVGVLAPIGGGERSGGDSADFAAVLLNTADTKLTITLEREDLLSVAANWNVAVSMTAHDIWQKMASVGTLSGAGLSLSVEPHGSRFLRLVAQPHSTDSGA